MVDLKSQYAPLMPEILASLIRVFESGRFILGPEVKTLEDEIAALHGARHAVGVASGTDALTLVWRALGIGPGDEVVVPAMTFLASASSVRLAGGIPVFADCRPDTLNVDPQSVEAAISRRTRALLAVHLYGQCADLAELRRIAESYGLPLVEDCAQSIGAAWEGRSAGSFGVAAITSFYPSKNLGAPGEGGMIWTSDDDLAARLKRLRNHGESRPYEHSELGTNSRLSAIAAAVLRIKLRSLAEWTAARRGHAAAYDEALGALGPALRPVHTDPRAYHVYHQYSLLSAGRDDLRDHLERAGVEVKVYYPIPLHLQPCFRDLGGRPGQFPSAERAAREVLSIPVHSDLTADQRRRVIEEIAAWSRSDSAVHAGGGR
jgi:dTDP-4-amino-4,6-dideoxygalactose transaminase